MRRRLAFATAVAPRPQVLLLDEPFTAVDEPTRIKIHQDVFDSVKQLNLTAILVTHDIAEAVSMCDRVIVLSRRPANVVSEHVIPFGNERDMRVLRDKPDFMEVYAQVWHALSGEL
jgi:ABC-type nitrate/sulfonate/bicarbonate transport system ATPase subunit